MAWECILKSVGVALCYRGLGFNNGAQHAHHGSPQSRSHFLWSPGFQDSWVFVWGREGSTELSGQFLELGGSAVLLAAGMGEKHMPCPINWLNIWYASGKITFPLEVWFG